MKGLIVAIAVLLLAPWLSTPASAFDYDPTPDGITEWTSKESASSGGRELPSVSADGRFVAYVGRGEGRGVWLTDRRLGTTEQLTTGSHFNPAVSDDGRWVAYVIYGSGRSVQVIEVATGVSTQVSLADDESPAGGLSDFPSISANGRFVAFQSTDKLLDDDVTQPAAGGGPNRAYVRDRQLGETEMVSVTDDGEASQGSAIKPDISPGGRYVAFAAEAANLLPPAAAPAAEEETAAQQIYLRDRQAGTTRLVTLGADDLPGDDTSAPVFGPTVSDDGRMVAYETLASNLVAGDTNADIDAYLTDMQTGTTTRLSLDADGQEVDLTNPVIDPTLPPEEQPSQPMVGAGAVVSGNGEVVAFVSEAPLTPDDLNGAPDNLIKDIYAVDIDADTLERVSLANEGGTEATGTRVDGNTGETVPQSNGNDPTVDRYGRHVAFVTNGNLTGDRPVDEESATEEVSTEPATFTRMRFGIDGWYVRALYADLLQRPADDPGLVHWVETLWLTDVRSTVVTPLMGSSEHRNLLVEEAYLTFLGRSADPSGLAFWSSRLASGTTLESMEASLLGSAEAYANAGSTPEGFVAAAYQAILQRAPDPGGLAFWVGFLEDGGSRTRMASTMIRSTESAGLRVDAAFQELLDRASDPAGRAYWVGVLTAGTSRLSMVRSILVSSEYYLRAETHLGS